VADRREAGRGPRSPHYHMAIQVAAGDVRAGEG
jgi:hypothetical protein